MAAPIPMITQTQLSGAEVVAEVAGVVSGGVTSCLLYARTSGMEFTLCTDPGKLVKTTRVALIPLA